MILLDPDHWAMNISIQSLLHVMQMQGPAICSGKWATVSSHVGFLLQEWENETLHQPVSHFPSLDRKLEVFLSSFAGRTSWKPIFFLEVETLARWRLGSSFLAGDLFLTSSNQIIEGVLCDAGSGIKKVEMGDIQGSATSKVLITFTGTRRTLLIYLENSM